jgi:hypothetical protein
LLGWLVRAWTPGAGAVGGMRFLLSSRRRKPPTKPSARGSLARGRAPEPAAVLQLTRFFRWKNGTTRSSSVWKKTKWERWGSRG